MPDIRFSAADWARIERDCTAWWNGQLDRPLLFLGAVSDRGRMQPVEGWYGFLSNYGPEVAPERVVEKFIEAESRRRYFGDTYPQWFVNFGPGVLAAPLGARVTSTPETVWFDPQPGVTIENLRVRFDRDDYWWRRIKEVTRAAVEQVGSVAQISYTDMGGNLDILASLVGSENLLIAMLEFPEKVDAAVRDVTREWIAAFDELDAIVRPGCPGTQGWTTLWAPGPSYTLQCDLSYMISPAMFERFVMPDLEACCSHVEYPFYHLDGVGEIAHLDYLFSIDNLRGIQWIPGDGKPASHEWIDLLRRIRDAGKLVQIFTTRDGARKVCREIDGGRGFALKVDDQMTPAQAEEFVEEIAKLSA